jgi:hypothetical protein
MVVVGCTVMRMWSLSKRGNGACVRGTAAVLTWHSASDSLKTNVTVLE